MPIAILQLLVALSLTSLHAPSLWAFGDFEDTVFTFLRIIVWLFDKCMV